MTIAQAYPNANYLKRRLRNAGITQRLVAERADVSLPHVCAVLAGRFKSRRVLAAAKALLAEAKARPMAPASAARAAEGMPA